MDTWNVDDLAHWSAGRWTGPRPGVVRGVSIDSRTLQPGNLFVALPGDKADGHVFLPQAHARGASAALVRCGTPPCGLPLLEVEDPRRALRDLAAGHRASLSARFVAVTGSTGKTTVKEMIADALATQAPTARTRGNWNNDLGLPLSLLAMSRGDRYGVFEVGMNHPGELDPLCALLRPDVSVVTSVGPVHLEFFPSIEGIAHEKAAVVRALGEGGLAVLPVDDAWFPVLASYARGSVCTIALRGSADYVADLGEGLAFTVRERATGEAASFEAPLPGDFIVHDALMAIAVGRRCGVPWDALGRALRGYRPLAMRWQREVVEDVLFINDAYNANPMSMRAALQAFTRTPVRGRRWLVLAGMRELGAARRAEHLALGRELADGPWAGLVAIGDDGALIGEGARAAGLPRVLVCRDAAAAASVLRVEVAAGDAVLLKASRGERLEDVVQEWKRTGPARADSGVE